jgi:hypothetical protein
MTDSDKHPIVLKLIWILLILINLYMLVIDIDSINRKGFWGQERWSYGNFLIGILYFLSFNFFNIFFFFLSGGSRIKKVLVIGFIYFIIAVIGIPVIQLIAPVSSIVLLIFFWSPRIPLKGES